MRRIVAEAKSGGATPAFLDRLSLDAERVDAMADGLDVIRKLKDPVGTVMASWRRPNGMRIERVRVPLGVVGVIYESRPNVTADAGALCLKAGNAAILRGGSESFRSCRAIHAALVEGLVAAGLPASAIALVPTRDREAVGMMLAGLDGAIDVIVPRGGKNLVARVQTEARVPVFAHLEGVCHVYVDGKAKLGMAKSIVLNAKMRRTGVCGAAETLLVDRAGAAKLLKPLVTMLLDAGCEIRGDAAVQAVDRRVKPASEADWGTEYLDAIITAGVVDGVDARDRAYRALRLASHRRDRDRRQDGGGEVLARSRFGDRAAQRLDAVRRRRRVRLWRRDRHRHRPTARARSGRRRTTDDFQIPHTRQRADAAMIVRGHAADRCGAGGGRCVGRGLFLKAMNWELVPARQVAARPGRRGCIVLPPHAPGMRIGLFGGTFDPPHAAHRAASLLALRRLGLDRLWWLVTPGNPLKDVRGLAPLAERVAAARALAHHPRIDVTDFEADLGTNYTYETISYLVRSCPGVHFVWIMGADNLRHFHRWQRWRDIAALVPIAVIDRLGPSLYSTAGVAGQALAWARIPELAATTLPERKPPAWIYLHGLKSPLSSTALRAARALRRPAKKGRLNDSSLKAK